MILRKKILLGIFLAFSILLPIGIPIGTFTYFMKDYGQIEAHRAFIYAHQTLNAVENFSISCEIGDVDIQYIDPPSDECAKIYLDIEMSGRGLVDKSVDDYFLVEWENETCSNLSISCKNSADPPNWDSSNRQIILNI